MKPYGRRLHDELEYPDLGPPSKERKLHSHTRRTGRRILHKQARNDAKMDIANRLGEIN